MKKLLLLVVIVAAAAGLWWWESPRLATENLLDAARDGDTAELEELVEVAAFRASLRAELGAGRPIPDLARPPADIVPRAPGAPPAPEAADTLLAGLAGDADLIALRQAARTEWEVERRGFNTFRVARSSGDGKPLAALLFARDGLHWKLVGVDAAS